MSERQQPGAPTLIDPSSSTSMSHEELHKILVEWNATQKEYPRHSCVHHLFEAQAQRTPGAIALSFEGQRLTYAELNARANQLSRHLSQLGVGPDRLVGISLERSLDLLVALLGILKAGGAYVPLDPSYPEDRLAYILQDSDAGVLVTQASVAAHHKTAARVVCLDKDWPAIGQESDANLDVPVSSSNLAYVLYTSGSTGKPKGVEIEHRNVVNFLWSMRQEPGLSREDRLVAVTTISFDIAGLELFLPLIAGAQVVLASRSVAMDGARLKAVLEDERATVMQATPATWRLLLDAGWRGDPRLKILCGGEALPRELANQLLPCCGSLWNMYGPTETTIWSSVYKVSDGEQALLPIGHPIGNTQMYILDSAGNPVRGGAEGELYIGGEGVARGYHNRPELTREKFVSDPFSSEPDARLYRTGDLARYLPDGNILFLGRIDHQVKIRGFRIELGEIEAVLAEHPAVQQNVVVARDGTHGEKHLVAYFVSRNGNLPRPPELRTFLQKKLPDYMLPATYVALDAFPLTPNGKVDRRALPPPDRTQVVAGEHHVGPRNPLETRLVQLWEEVLGISPISVTANYFDLGASSLAAARLFTRISKEFKRELPLSFLYEAPSIEQIARRLTDDANAPLWKSLVPIQTQGSGVPLFCVHGGGGGTLFMRGLARHLGQDRPFYGLQAEAVHGRRIKGHRVEDMAAHYVSEIRTVHPDGPFFLSGYCLGGVIAVEMARQLKQQGFEVPLVALFNAANPALHLGGAAADDDEGGREAAIAQSRQAENGTGHLGFKGHWQKMRSMRWTELPGYMMQALRSALRWRVQPLRRKIRRFTTHPNRFWEILCLTYVRLGGRVPPMLRWFYIAGITHWAERHYTPTRYPGSLTVFSGAGLYSEPSAGWEGLADEIETCVISGQHRIPAQIMYEPSVSELAEKLRSRMLSIQSEATQRGSRSGAAMAPSAIV
jgi:amino acid adenylation domain-containing protein